MEGPSGGDDIGTDLLPKSFLTELYSFAVINQMQIHGILRPEWFMGCYGIRNLAVSFDGFLVQGAAGCFDKQRNRAVDHRNQSWNYNIFAA